MTVDDFLVMISWLVLLFLNQTELYDSPFLASTDWTLSVLWLDAIVSHAMQNSTSPIPWTSIACGQATARQNYVVWPWACSQCNFTKPCHFAVACMVCCMWIMCAPTFRTATFSSFSWKLKKLAFSKGFFFTAGHKDRNHWPKLKQLCKLTQTRLLRLHRHLILWNW